MVGFSYTPLNYRENEVRLLEFIDAGPSDGPKPRFRLIQDSLDNVQGTFHALSYVWGSSLATSVIDVDGEDFHITPELLSALQEIRKQSEWRRVWIDAVCINQDDPYERDSQVDRLGLIYSYAKSTIAWLGEADTTSSSAIREMQALNLLQPDPGLLSSVNMELPSELRSPTIRTTPFDSNACGLSRASVISIRRLFERPYWRRKWILQEIAKSQEVFMLCGSSGIRLEHLIRPCIGQFGRRFLTAEVYSIMLGFQRFRAQEQVDETRMPLAEALFLSRHSHASDPRDDIYAVLHMTGDHERVVPTPSYKVSNTESQVSAQCSWNMMVLQGKMDLIMLARRNPKERSPMPGLPSWAPAWSRLASEIPPWISSRILKTSHDKRGSSSMLNPERFRRIKDSLRIRGVLQERIGAVAGSAEARYEPLSSLDGLSTSSEPRTQCLDDRHPAWKPEHVLESLWVHLTLCAMETPSAATLEAGPERSTDSSMDFQNTAAMTTGQKAFVMALVCELTSAGRQKGLFNQFYPAIQDLSFCERTIDEWIECYLTSTTATMKISARSKPAVEALPAVATSDSGYESMCHGDEYEAEVDGDGARASSQCECKSASAILSTVANESLAEGGRYCGICQSHLTLTHCKSAISCGAESNQHRGVKRRVDEISVAEMHGIEPVTDHSSNKRLKLAGTQKLACLVGTPGRPNALEIESALTLLERGLEAMMSHRMTLVVTNYGRFRIAYDKARIGDFIFQLENCTLPVMLRRQKQRWLNQPDSEDSRGEKPRRPVENSQFLFVGEVFQEDMQLQAWSKFDNAVKQVFIL